MTATPRVTLVVLSEDWGQSGWSAVHRITRRTLDFIVSDLDWQHGVEITPRAEVPVFVQEICKGNAWHVSKRADPRKQGELFRYVAALLDENATHPVFVMFHVDGDRTWSESRRNPSVNLQQFDDIVRVGVRRTLTERSKIQRSGQEMDRLMSRLLVIAAYYEIEAWLYQSTATARDLCRARTCRGKHAAQYDAWAQDRGQLDEIPQFQKRKTEGLHCLDDDDKNALSSTFPVGEVYDNTEKSYHAWVDELTANADFFTAIQTAKFASV